MECYNLSLFLLVNYNNILSIALGLISSFQYLMNIH